MEKNDLMTVSEIAAAKNVSEKTVRRWIAECDVEADVIDPGSTHTNYFSLDRLDIQMSKRNDLELVSSMSDTGKLKFMIGHIELEGTQEQRDAIREYVDSQVQQAIAVTEQKHLVIESKIKAERDDAESRQHYAERRTRQLMLQVPKSKLTADEQAWAYAPSFDDILRRHGLR